MFDVVDQLDAFFDRVGHRGVRAACLLHVEVGVGRGQQGVVASGLQAAVAGAEHLPRGQRLEDGIGCCQLQPQAAAGVEKVLVGVDQRAGIGLDSAGVRDIGATAVGTGHPQHAGFLEFGRGDLNAGLRGRHDQRPGVGESQCRGQVDRQGLVGRRQPAPAPAAAASSVRSFRDR